MDYFTKWPEAKALETADAKEVARFIYEDIICRHRSKLNNTEDWDLKIPNVLFAYRTKRNDSIKMEPGYLIYGRQMKILLNLEDKEITMMERINGLIEKLPEIRNQAKENVRKSQEKQKLYHDKRNKLKKNFQIGDKYYIMTQQKRNNSQEN
ncbi:unnamed protein product [Rhizophagus irregularis]|nr:unnamed protein product [Rhizophagus irregularis]